MLNQNQIAAEAADLNNRDAWAFIREAVRYAGYSGSSATALLVEMWELVKMERHTKQRLRRMDAERSATP